LNAKGEREYMPVAFDRLAANNFVCETCGYRYTRRSFWDYVDLLLDPDSFTQHADTHYLIDEDILRFPDYATKLHEARRQTGLLAAMVTGEGTLDGMPITLCGTDFGFFGGSFCMSTGEKLWRAATHTIERKLPMILIACGGGARMQEGCSSMVSIPKAHLAVTRVECAGLLVITLITDPTLGGVAIGYGSRGTRLFEENAGNIGFSGRRVIEQYTGKTLAKDFQTTQWLKARGHAKEVIPPNQLRQKIRTLLKVSSADTRD
jgi:acetyl-CoA carboxylase beta subunit